MHKSRVIEININQLIIATFCCYAFSMPFELLLEIGFNIKTIFKPFRIFSILIIGLYMLKVVKEGLYIDTSYKADWLFYGVFLYGLLISCIKMISDIFDMSLFFNDAFQSGLHLATFFIYKNTPVSKKQQLLILKFFIAGICINAFYIFGLFTYYQRGRHSGFTDNPNYAALGIVVAVAYFFLKLIYTEKPIFQIGYLIPVLFLAGVSSFTGSRTGFIMLLILCLFLFAFSSIWQKITLVLFISFTAIVIIPQLDSETFKGATLLSKRLDRTIGGEEDVRLVVWRGVFKTLEKEGYEGMGIGQFKAKFPRYFNNEPNQLIVAMVAYGYHLSPHNDYLAILADYGLPSLFLYLLFLATMLMKLFKRAIGYSDDQEEKMLAQFSFLVFLCLILFGMASENFQHQLYWFLLMFTTKRTCERQFS